MKKQVRIILCADDFGISPGVSSSIINLIGAGKITATSCMSISPFWKAHASSLRPLKGKADIGLHLTLTGFQPLGPMPMLARNGYLPSYGRLLMLSLTGGLDLDEIRMELIRQLDCFEEVWGTAPDFIDGHLFVHHLPLVRDAFVDLYKERFRGSNTYIRVSSASVPVIFRRRVSILKTLAIGYFGWRLKRIAALHRIPYNNGFSGIYDFSDRVPYKKLFEKFLIDAKTNMQIMCHPGLADSELAGVDNLTNQREKEYSFFCGNDFWKMLENAGVSLGRFTFEE